SRNRGPRFGREQLSLLCRSQRSVQAFLAQQRGREPEPGQRELRIESLAALERGFGGLEVPQAHQLLATSELRPCSPCRWCTGLSCGVAKVAGRRRPRRSIER